jgi:hypothetical protein
VWKSWKSSLSSFLQSSLTSSVLGSNIFLFTSFWNILSVFSFSSPYSGIFSVYSLSLHLILEYSQPILFFFTLFWNILSLFSSLNAIDQLWHQHKITSKTVFHILQYFCFRFFRPKYKKNHSGPNGSKNFPNLIYC